MLCLALKILGERVSVWSQSAVCKTIKCREELMAEGVPLKMGA